MKIRLFLSVLVFMSVFSPNGFAARSDYPVVFAHGFAGFDNILGFDYFGDDYGSFAGNGWANPWLSIFQESFAASVTPFHSSEQRGWELANEIEGYLATTGSSSVNIIAHSQGGHDARKAAVLLRQRKGERVVRVLCSISSAHRGWPVAQYILGCEPGVQGALDTLLAIYGTAVYGPGNDLNAALLNCLYDDNDPDDGVTTGMKDYNQHYPVSPLYAGRYVSLVTAQEGLAVNPALYLFRELIYDIDGDGYCVDDCDHDGAAGCGDGDAGDCDDDGLVGINSQQMGYRLYYHESWLFDRVGTDWSMGYVGDLNYPDYNQMTSHASVINQDHLDVIGVGPDTFDEMEFYAALIDYIDYYEEY